MKSLHVAAMIGGVVLATSATAETIRVDLQNTTAFGRNAVTFNGVEAKAAAADARFASDGTDLWNAIGVPAYPTFTSAVTFSNLRNSLGATTGVGLSLAGLFTSATDNIGQAYTGANTLFNDYLALLSGPVSYSVTGLTADADYTLATYAPSFSAGRGYTLTANGTTLNVSDGANNIGVATIRSTAAGTIAGTWSRVSGEGNWSGFQLASSPTVSAVPEPASWAMMIAGVGLVGSSLRRRTARVRTTIAFG